MEEDAQELYNCLWEEAEGKRHFIAPTPVSLERRHLGKLQSTHVVAEKSDGERVMWLLGRREDTGKPYSVLVRRDRSVTPLHCTLGDTDVVLPVGSYGGAKNIFDGTLLDGEWMPGGIIVFDAVVVAGYSLKEMDFKTRLSTASALLPLLAPNLSVNVCVKSFYEVSRAAQVYAEFSRDGVCDGLILMPKYDGVRKGRHETCYKWKPVEKCTVDLKWNGRKWTAVGDRGQDVTRLPFTPPPSHMDLVTGAVYEIAPGEKKEDPWVMVKVRPDKVAANHVETVRRTLKTIDDNIQVNEIM